MTNAGTLALRTLPIQNREADFDPPDAPNPLTVESIPAGEALSIELRRPPQSDLTGYLVAVGAATSSDTPTIDRKARPAVGVAIAPGVFVRATADASVPSVQVDDLTDNTAYRVLVYAYDGDAQGQPLNYSAAAVAFGTPQDTEPPGAPKSFMARPAANDLVSFDLVAPGEDGETTTNAVTRFEMRISASADDLMTPEQFELQFSVPPPTAVPPGETASFTRAWSQLGYDTPPETPIYAGIRAVDAASNAGPAAVVAIFPDDNPPQITVIPQVAVTGQELVLTGLNFGPTLGRAAIRATETATVTYPLSISQWTSTSVVVTLPHEARTGDVELTRTDDAVARAPIVILSRQVQALGPAEPALRSRRHQPGSARRRRLLHRAEPVQPVHGRHPANLSRSGGRQPVGPRNHQPPSRHDGWNLQPFVRAFSCSSPPTKI